MRSTAGVYQWSEESEAVAAKVSRMFCIIMHGGRDKAVATAKVRAIVKRLFPANGSVRSRLRFLRTFGLWGSPLRSIPTGVQSVLFVCHGNIIRSPMAAALLERHFSDADCHEISVASAGLYAKPDRGADARALVVAKEFGVSLDNHRCRPLTKEMVERSNAIVAMDCLNAAALFQRYPGARQKVFLLGAIDDGQRSRAVEITDPYYGDLTDVRRCYQILQSHIHRLARLLSPPKPAWDARGQCSQI
jgi:protein-tyrosine phosphatase